MNDIKNNIMKAIKADEVTMRSRLFFMTRTALWLSGILVVLSATLFLGSFVIFLLRGNGLLEVAHFGTPGIVAVLFSLPWLTILGVIILAVTLEILAKHFAFVYKKPLVYSLLGVLLVIILGAVLVAQSSIHERVFELNREHPLPGVGPLYEGAMRDIDDVRIGIIQSIDEDSLVLVTRGGETFEIVLTPETRMPPRPLSEGEVVVVMTDESSEVGTTTALGLRPLDKERTLLPRHDRGGSRPDEQGIPPIPPSEIYWRIDLKRAFFRRR